MSTQGNTYRLEKLRTVHSVQNFSLCNPFIFLSRNDQECLLTNGRHLDPLLFSEGKEFVQRFLNYISKTNTRSALTSLHPDYDQLIDLLLAFGILDPVLPAAQGTTGRCEKRYPIGEDGFALYLLLTQFCNLSCIYCLNGDRSYQRKKKLKMPENIALKAVEFFSKRLKEGAKGEIIFFGGEPLLNWDTAKKVTRFCESELREKIKGKLNFNLTSNLVSVPSDLSSWGKEYDVGFLCDIDGPEELHNRLRPFATGGGSFDHICSNVKKLVSEGFDIALRATVSSHNVNSMVEIARIHKELGGYSTAFIPLTPITSDECVLPESWYPDPQAFADGLLEVVKSGIYKIEKISPVNQMLKDLLFRDNFCSCGAPFGNSPVVDANGDIYPCIYWVGLDRLKIGNILEPDKFDMSPLQWLSDTVDVDKNDSCSNCEYRYLCQGGCPASWIVSQASKTGTPQAIQYGRSITCAVNKTLIPYLLWYLVENPGLIDEFERVCPRC